ncbi:NPHN protein, partial [Sula dactylatra]|nr:NPHN protein [Sula dactylatra]
AAGGEPLPDVSTHIFEGSHPKLSSSEVTARLTAQSHAHGQRLVCSAANEAGPAPAEASVTLDVLFPPSAPTIEGLESPHVRAGDTLRLVCIVRGGNPPPSLHWDKVLVALGALGRGTAGTGSTESTGRALGALGALGGHWELWEH